jgi:GTPase
MIVKFPNQPPELDYGNREYKRLLKLCNRNSFESKATQMLYRIYEGNGLALYLIGIDDNGRVSRIKYSELTETIECLREISRIINANIKKINIYRVDDTSYVSTLRITKEI